ncbi:MAG: pyrimidine 5'-nucleotidase, partial [Paracoccaceae bacterium]|nr:pyrimidine 5'-nucleotidase [Paracoccaceae bacterium]
MSLSFEFSKINTWVFDLDNTLYPPKTNLFAQIEKRMTKWVMQTLELSQVHADELR